MFRISFEHKDDTGTWHRVVARHIHEMECGNGSMMLREDGSEDIWTFYPEVRYIRISSQRYW